jgi:glycosyltransferase involved in cell wall biosynthesis
MENPQLNMGDTTISIVIPTKNEEKYIDRTLAQFEGSLERLDLEIIISDAGSKDRTADIVSDYASRSGGRIRLVQPEGKQNIAIGRNAGAAVAKGGILMHMDADVRIPDINQFFTTVRARFEDPAVVAATMPLWIYPEESGVIDKFYHILMNLTIRLSFSFGVFLAKGECQFVRRSVFEKIGGYNETIVAGEDCNLFYRLHKEGKIAYLYRLHIYHSPRRFRQYGYLGVSWIYLREGISLLIRRKSYIKEWKPVR